MRIESVDDYVWERYESWPGFDGFKAYIQKQFPLFDVLHHSWWQVRDHAEEKAEEHGKKHMKLKLFQDSLDPKLRDCVDPFLIQQDQLRVAYRTIYLSHV